MEDENNSLLITEVANLCDDEQLVEETVKESSLLIAGGFSLLGGLIAGPFGSAIGGTLGAALMKDTRRKFFCFCNDYAMYLYIYTFPPNRFQKGN